MLPKTVHSKPLDTPEGAVVASALVACVLHLGGFIVLDPIDYGVAIGACLTPVAMLLVRIAVAVGDKVEDAVDSAEEETEDK
jgi:hypothetical protein